MSTQHKNVYQTADQFKAIMTGNSDDPAVKVYFDQEYSNQGANQRAQYEANRNDPNAEPWPAMMIPRYYRNSGYLQSQNLLPTALPIYTIDGDVVIADSELKRGLYIWRCRFTDTVNLVNLRSKYDIIFHECIFEKQIIANSLMIRRLAFTESLAGSVNFTIINSELHELSIVNNSIIIPSISSTKVQILSIKNK